MVLKEGYRPEHFVPGPLARAMNAGGILYLEEMNRAPSGALNVLMTALSERYLEVPRLGRGSKREPGFTVVGAANPLDDVGTTRLSRGLVDRFVTLELDYQRARRRARDRGPPLRRRARRPARVRRRSRARVARRIPTCATAPRSAARSTSSTCWPAGRDDELDLDTLRFLACSAYAGKLRVKPSAGKTAAEVVHELIDKLLRRDYGGSVETLLEQAVAGAHGRARRHRRGRPRRRARRRATGGERPPERPGDEIPGLVRPGTGKEAGESRSVPMVGRDRPSNGGARIGEAPDPRDSHLRDPELVLRHARELVLRLREGVPAHAGAPGTAVLARPWTDGGAGPARARGHDRRVLQRGRRARRHLHRAPQPPPARLRDPRRPLRLDGRPQADAGGDDGRRARAAERRGPRRLRRDRVRRRAQGDQAARRRGRRRGGRRPRAAAARGPRDRHRPGAAGRGRGRRTGCRARPT